MVERTDQSPQITVNEERVLTVVKHLLEARANSEGFFKGTPVDFQIMRVLAQ